jgi:hypothetical protein
MLVQEGQTSSVSVACDSRYNLLTFNSTPDTDEQLEEFRKDPAKLAKYSRDIEGELNKRFTLVCSLAAQLY